MGAGILAAKMIGLYTPYQRANGIDDLPHVQRKLPEPQSSRESFLWEHHEERMSRWIPLSDPIRITIIHWTVILRASRLPQRLL